MLHAIGLAQYGYFTSKQAIKAGYIKSTHQNQVSNGTWVKISTGLYRLPGFTDSMEADFTRCCIWSRNQQEQPQGVISHKSALAFHGHANYDPKEIHLTVPLRFRKRIPDGIIIHKAILNLSSIEGDDNYLVTNLSQTLQDMQHASGVPNDGSDITKRSLSITAFPSEKAFCHGDPTDSKVPNLSISPQSEGVWKMLYNRTQTGRWKYQAGFTLVELLTVVAICTILASFFFPVLLKSVKGARTISCLGLLKQFASCNQMYGNENRDFSLSVWYGFQWTGNPVLREMMGVPIYAKGTTSTLTVNWPVRLFCPDATGRRSGDENGYRIALSYGMNYSDFSIGWNPSTYKGYRMSALKLPSKLIQWTDGVDMMISRDKSDPIYYNSVGEEYTSTVAAYRHLNRINLSFYDGHAKTFTPNTATYNANNTDLWIAKGGRGVVVVP